VKLKETEIGQMPEHWALVPLADVATVKTSTAELSRLKKAQADSGQGISVLFLKVSDMNLPGNHRTISMAQEHAIEDVRKEAISSLSIVPPGSVVLPKRGAAIATNKKRLTGKHCILDPNILAVIPGDQVDSDYLFGWFEQVDLRKITDATTLPQLNKKDIEPLLFPMPLLVEQQVIARTLRTCDTKIEAEENRRQAFDALFQSLLHHLMTGKVRVHDLELPSMKEDAP
jgi:type I restriction enzyme S subunit